MTTLKQTINTGGVVVTLLVSICLCSCDRGNDAEANASPLWSSASQTNNSYQHLEHLQKLLQEANALIATNPTALSPRMAYGKLARNSPLRGLLGILADEPAELSYSKSMDACWVNVSSSKTGQRLGRIQLSLLSGRVESVYDVQALALINEMERRLRQVAGTREEALRLFGGQVRNPSPQRVEATEALAAALFLPKHQNYYIQMSAPGGSNRGHGHLTIMLQSSNSFDWVARVGYPRRDNLFSAFGCMPARYPFGGLLLAPAWTNLNTEGFLLDSERFPYSSPRAQERALAH